MFAINIKLVTQNGGGAEQFMCHGSSNSRGVSFFITKKLEYKVHNVYDDDQRNFILLDITLGETRLTSVTLYGPQYFRKTMRFVKILFGTCGDFNLV